jgi:hypothetical protein
MMEFEGLNVFQPLPMLKSDVRSDLGIHNSGKTNTHTIFYIESLVDQIPTKKTVTDLSHSGECHHRD